MSFWEQNVLESQDTCILTLALPWISVFSRHVPSFPLAEPFLDWKKRVDLMISNHVQKSQRETHHLFLLCTSWKCLLSLQHQNAHWRVFFASYCLLFCKQSVADAREARARVCFWSWWIFHEALGVTSWWVYLQATFYWWKNSNLPKEGCDSGYKGTMQRSSQGASNSYLAFHTAWSSLSCFLSGVYL